MNVFKKFLSNFRLTTTEKIHQPQDGYKPLNAVKFLRQIITADSRTSRLLMWHSDEKLKNVRLEYKMIGEDAAQFGKISAVFFDEDFIYSCKLENLKPESLYKFRIISDDRATDWQNLKTTGCNDFQMLVFSDSQCTNYKIWQKTADTAAKNYPDAEIFVMNGDLIDAGQDFQQWRAWYTAAQNLLKEKILVPVMGNHECYNCNYFNSPPTGYLQNFKLPTNGIKNFDGYFYSFDYGAARFFVLNTQFYELQNFTGDIKDAQEYFFRREVRNSNSRWKIVFMHKPIYNRKFSDFVAEAKNYFIPLFDELEIDVVISGHFHKYRNCGKFHGTNYVVCGLSGDQNYTGAPDSFLVINFGADSINFICQSVDGKILDNFNLEK